jgi:hypothetical protein
VVAAGLCLGAALAASRGAVAEGESGACAELVRALPAGHDAMFLASFPTATPGPLAGVAFLYDNAVAAIALVGCGEVGSARRIGDAMVWALDHDRFWHDGRLRNAYAAGAVHDDPVKLGGWWDPGAGRWLEDAYQVSTDTGNMAWAMLALLALDGVGHDARYRDAAVRIGGWVAARRDERGAGGFTGGYGGWEPAPAALRWKSTEHNTDLAAAFARLRAATADPAWSDRAADAAGFVAAMWDAKRGLFTVGTGDDGVTPNRGVALDAQLWPLLAIQGMGAAHAETVLATIDTTLAADGGYGYSDAGRKGAGKGLWTEGTAQAALAAKLLGRLAVARAASAAVASQHAPGLGYYATDVDALPTGFADASSPGLMRSYFHLPHLAATAWAALAERSYNPFTGTARLP